MRKLFLYLPRETTLKDLVSHRDANVGVEFQEFLLLLNSKFGKMMYFMD